MPSPARFPNRPFLPALAVLFLLHAPLLEALVITEVLYNPSLPAGETDGRLLEYIEIYNENQDPLDLSGYSVCNGVDFEFPEGTWLEGRSYLVLCAKEAKIRALYSITNTLGDWFIDPETSPSLSNGGERIEICNPAGKTVVEVEYNDRNAWPAGADGAGHSLSLIGPFREIDDAESWTLSLAPGGTPGGANGHEPEETVGPSGSARDGGGFINKWLVLGPYTGSSCNLGAALTQDWLRESAGGLRETNLQWTDGQVVNTNYALAASAGIHPNASTATPTIERYSTGGDTINLNDSVYPPDPENVMAYSFVYVDNVTGANLPVTLACASDDGISVLLNGVHVHSNDACRGVGGPGEVQDRAPATLLVGKNVLGVKVFENGGGWSFRLRIEERGTGTPLVSDSKIQVTTDRTQGLLIGGGGTPFVPPPPPPPGPGETPGEAPVLLNEGLFFTSGPRWIELYNRSGEAVELGGHYLTNDASNLAKSRIADGTSIAPGAWRTFTDTELGLDFSVALPGDRVFVALVDPDGKRVLDAVNFEPDHAEMSEARVPDGDRELDDAADPTPGAANTISVNTDVVFNEIMYHPIDNDPRREYLEIYNRGSVSHHMTGWKLTNGLDFDFPPGTVIPAGGYIVVARDPALIRSIYGLGPAVVLGPETSEALADLGILRDDGERLTLSDELGRTVDTVRYHDGGEWSRWADGLGSSLELIDPYQDNRRGQAWDASDDSSKSAAEEYIYVARHAAGDSELAMLLLTRGITLVDDISIIGGGITVTDTQLISTSTSWKYLKGTTEPPAAWKQPTFDDSTWLAGSTGIGYGDNDDTTVLSDMQQTAETPGYMTIFCRKTFNVTNRDLLGDLILTVNIDDGFHAYLNGEPVGSYNVISTAFDAAATTAVEPNASNPVTLDLTSHKDLIQNGTNLLAIQVHNAGRESTDLTFIPRLFHRRLVTGPGGSEHVANGTFDSNTSGWVIEGTHVRSGRTTQSPITGAGSLKILASGRGDNKVNRIETPTAGGTGLTNLPANQDLIVSFKAKWIVGSQSLLTHGYDHEMAKSHRLNVPLQLGTPGAVNSVTLRQTVVDPSGDLGPVISDVSQDPPVPPAGQAVKVTARIHDPDGVGAVSIRYSLTNPSANPASAVMSRIGTTEFFEGTIPGQALNARVVFFITAADVGGRPGRYPADITRRTHPLLLNPPSAGLNDHRYLIYMHDVPKPPTAYHSYRFYMTQANETELTSRRLLSNDLVDGSFVFGASAIYYESHARFAGSPFARAGLGGSFRVVPPRDKPVHGRLRRVHLEDHHGNGLNAKERISHYLLRQNRGSLGIPYSDLFVLARWQVNNSVTSTKEHVWVPDNDFLSLWFPGDDEGDFFEMDDRFLINDQGTLAGNTDARVLYPPPSSRGDSSGANKENYRWFHNLRAKNGADEFASFIGFARVMDPNATSDSAFDQRIDEECNVEELVRMWAVWKNIDHWDSWGQSRGKNCYLYRPEATGLWTLFAWDLELTYGNTSSFLIPSSPDSSFDSGGFGEVNRMLNRPRIKRMYYSVLDEMVNGPNRWFHSSYLGDYATRLGELGMSDVGIALPGGFIDQRSALLRTRIQSTVYPQVRLTITTNSGNDFASAQPTINLAGTAPAEVSDIVVSRNGDAGNIYPTAYTSMRNWTITGIPLQPGTANTLTLYGFDLSTSNPVDSDTITVTSTLDWEKPVLASVAPDQALAGMQVELLGTDFHDGLRVFFGTTLSPAIVFSEGGPDPGKIVATVPAGSGTVNVTVRNADNQVSNAVSFTYLQPPPAFIRGDAGGDGIVDISDALKVLLHLFSGVPVNCEDASDADDNEALNLADSLVILNYLFKDGPAPPAPFPLAGVDPSGDELGCER